MSRMPQTKIEGREGFFLFNEGGVSYQDGISLPSVRITNPKSIRHLQINKYIPLRYLLVLLKEKRLILNKVTTWEDPYENFFLKEQFVQEGYKYGSYHVSVENLAKGLYGMSWSMQDETDSLWRIYSPDKLSVRITTSVEVLVETVMSEDNKWGTWFDKVKYKTESEIDNWLDHCLSVSDSDQFVEKLGESFFIKRKAFQAEKEFRLVVNYYDKKCPQATFVCFRIDPTTFISSYITDPRLTKNEHEAVKAALVNAGAPKKLISMSKLYQFTPRRVEMRYDPFEDF